MKDIEFAVVLKKALNILLLSQRIFFHQYPLHLLLLNIYFFRIKLALLFQLITSLINANI